MFPESENRQLDSMCTPRYTVHCDPHTFENNDAEWSIMPRFYMSPAYCLGGLVGGLEKTQRRVTICLWHWIHSIDGYAFYHSPGSSRPPRGHHHFYHMFSFDGSRVRWKACPTRGCNHIRHGPMVLFVGMVCPSRTVPGDSAKRQRSRANDSGQNHDHPSSKEPDRHYDGSICVLIRASATWSEVACCFRRWKRRRRQERWLRRRRREKAASMVVGRRPFLYTDKRMEAERCRPEEEDEAEEEEEEGASFRCYHRHRWRKRLNREKYFFWLVRRRRSFSAIGGVPPSHRLESPIRPNTSRTKMPQGWNTASWRNGCPQRWSPRPRNWSRSPRWWCTPWGSSLPVHPRPYSRRSGIWIPLDRVDVWWHKRGREWFPIRRLWRLPECWNKREWPSVFFLAKGTIL